jgi:phospholipase A1
MTSMQVIEEIRRLMEVHKDEATSITVTGHSLGAALAVLTAYEIAAATRDADDVAPMVTAVSFGCPRVGNAAFRRRLEASGGKVLRVANSNDLVTKVPGLWVDEYGSVKRWMASKIGWAYSDVGRELLLSGHDLPRNVVASHHLDLYLKLVAACTY